MNNSSQLRICNFSLGPPLGDERRWAVGCTYVINWSVCISVYQCLVLCALFEALTGATLTLHHLPCTIESVHATTIERWRIERWR